MLSNFKSTKIIELGSCAFRQPNADSHCRFIHGYRLTAKFTFECTSLDKNHWVQDFGGLKELKEILNKQFDHTTCIAADDPALLIFKELEKVGACDLRIMENGTGIERIAEWCYNAADKFFDKHCIPTKFSRVWVSEVEVWEHEKNSAIYYDRTFSDFHNLINVECK